jgi:D-alanine transaminase
MQVYLNGSFQSAETATVSVDDRGFLFADGAYEVIRAYPGGLLLPEAHLERLHNSLAGLRIDAQAAADVVEIGERLLDMNGLRGTDATIYIQVTRGAAPRRHAFPPAGTAPCVYVATRPSRSVAEDWYAGGCAAITVPDTRWSRCDIKSIALLPNVLANQAAQEAGAFEALFVRDGMIVEGSHTNVFAVAAGTLITYPSGPYMLDGITRAIVLDIARELGVPVRHTGLRWEHLHQVDELFLSGTTTEVLPVGTVDGRPIAGGGRGPITKRILQAFRKRLPR